MEQIIVFGRGRYFEQKEEALRKSYKIIAFLDNAVKDRIYDEKYECYVYNPKLVNEAEELKGSKIMCMSLSFVEMWQQLKKLGVADERIAFGVHISPLHKVDKMLFENGEELLSHDGKLLYISKRYGEHVIESAQEYAELKRKIFRLKHEELAVFEQLHLEPPSRIFGCERGRAVDRFYIERFLAQNAADVRGIVMEIASNAYIRKYGGEKVDKEIILHVEGWGRNAIKGNFETGEGITENMVDCLICTQTLQYIYNLPQAIHNIYTMIKKDGVGLFTVPGIKSLSVADDSNWGDYWSFTKRSVKRLLETEFGEENVQVEAYGNAKVAMAYLYGLCVEDLGEDVFQYNDEQFPFLIVAKVIKK